MPVDAARRVDARQYARLYHNARTKSDTIAYWRRYAMLRRVTASGARGGAHVRHCRHVNVATFSPAD